MSDDGSIVGRIRSIFGGYTSAEADEMEKDLNTVADGDAPFEFSIRDLCMRSAVEMHNLREENRKLREAVIYERARYIWGHRKCDSEQDAFAVAERELRVEGVIT